MAFRRKTYRKKYGSRYHKRFKRKFQSHFRKNRSQRVFRFTRYATGVIQVKDSAVDYAFIAHLSDLPSYTEFTSLFDSYRINGVALTLEFNHNSSESGATGGGQTIPNLITAMDYDNATLLNNENQYLQYATYKCRQMNHPIKLFWRPKTVSPVYGTGAFSSYSETKKDWIDCAYPGVEYYGLKYRIAGNQNSNTDGVTVGYVKYIAKFYMSFKTVQ